MKRILITGSSGTIGTELVRQLQNTEHELILVDKRENRWLDKNSTIVSDISKSLEIRRSIDLDMVIHLAAHARVHDLVKEPRKAKENVDMTFRALEIAREHDAEFVFAGSREVYGNREHGRFPIAEHEVDHREAESPYTASKIAGESFVKSYEKCYDLDACIVRFSNVYGKYDASNRVVPLFIAQTATGQDLTVYGEGKTLDFTHVDDTVDGILRVIENFDIAASRTFNLASGNGHTIRELAETIRHAMEANNEIHVEPNRTGEIEWYVADIEHARRALDYQPTVGFDEGIYRAIQWYQNRPELYSEILK